MSSASSGFDYDGMLKCVLTKAVTEAKQELCKSRREPSDYDITYDTSYSAIDVSAQYLAVLSLPTILQYAE